MDSILGLARDGYCSGCGACSFVNPSSLRMTAQADGTILPELCGALDRAAISSLAICPMSGVGETESEIAARLWPNLPNHPLIGRHHATFAAHVADEASRMQGGSGGLVTWLATELLRLGEIDCVLHVQHSACGPMLFEYAVSHTETQIRNGAKSRYYPVEMSQVLRELVEGDHRAALIGVPCFIKAARGLIATGHLPQEKLPYLIGLVCGHLKSTNFADYLAWQSGIAPGDLSWCDFREKLTDRPASDYGFAMRARTTGGSAPAKVVPMAKLKGKDWGEGLFRLTACEFCDDVLAECADIAIGDAWLPQFVSDPRGENIVVVRDMRLAALIDQAAARDELVLTAVSPDDVAQSQASGLRHRREGLAHRLARRLEAGKTVPRKRVAPQLAPSANRREIYDLRLEVAQTSNTAMTTARHEGDLAVFDREMAPLLSRLKRATYGTVARRLLRRLKREIQTVFRFT